MRLLLDTHVLLWWFNEPERLTAPSQPVIADEHNEVFVSTASIWEAGIKQAPGKLQGADGLAERVVSQRLRPLPISFHHAELATGLPPHHSDPVDRMVVAQAQAESLTLVSRDEQLAAYDVAVLAG